MGEFQTEEERQAEIRLRAQIELIKQAYEESKKKKKKAVVPKKDTSVITRGLESKLRDPNSELSDSEQKTVDRVLLHGVQEVGGPFSLLGDNRI